jgi:TATA-binding protein-associated factor Taf7
MLLVMPDGPEAQAKVQHYEANGWQHSDGLTPPLKDVRTRRFSRTASYGKQKDVEAIEKRVQALLDRDTAATSSSFTIYDSMGKTLLRGGATDGKFEPPKEGKEEESDDEFAAELEEAMLAEDAMEVETQPESMAPTEDATQEMLAEEPEELTPEAPIVIQSTAVMELREKINERKAQLASVTNPMIKARLEDVIRQLEEDLYSRL